MPGDGIEESETKEDAFIREIKEETGYDCKINCYAANVIGQPHDITLTEAEKELGFQLTWMGYQQAAEIMNKSIQVCTDYSLCFMLLRDSTILNEGWKIISQSQETPQGYE